MLPRLPVLLTLKFQARFIMSTTAIIRNNTYVRSEGGAEHKALVSASDTTGVLLHPNVVMALVMSYGIGPDGQHSVYGDSGSGTAYVFQDGGVTKGTWHKSSQTANFSFTDANDAPIKLNAGQTWITLCPR